TLEQLRAELAELKGAGRAEIARQISEAREKGDLKENAEYDAAKEAQGLHEAKIAQLESVIAQARILDKSKIDTSKATILSTVSLLNPKMKKKGVYQIVSEQEADLKAGKISVKSPIGRGLLGHAKVDTVEISVPSGVLTFVLEEI